MKMDDLKVFLNYRPVNVMWQSVKVMYNYGHKAITATRAAKYFVEWTIRYNMSFVEDLRDVKDLKPFRPLRWKHKVCYFTGTLNGKDVFIKTGGEIKNTEREVYAMSYAVEQSVILKNHIPEILEAHEDCLIEEMIAGEPLTQNDAFIPQLYDIYRELKRCNILHLDIRPENFIVKNDGNLVLIDFGYALVNTYDIFDRIERTNEVKRVIKNLGSKFSPKNGTVDDAYSMLLTMKYVCPSLLKLYPDIWYDLNTDIGQRCVSFGE